MTRISMWKEYDGHHHFGMVERAVDKGIDIDQLWGDCHFSSNPSYAILSVHYGIDLRANLPEEGSKISNIGIEDIKSLYQKFWKEKDFKVNASEEDMLRYLVRKGMRDYLLGVKMVNSGWKIDLIEID